MRRVVKGGRVTEGSGRDTEVWVRAAATPANQDKYPGTRRSSAVTAASSSFAVTISTGTAFCLVRLLPSHSKANHSLTSFRLGRSLARRERDRGDGHLRAVVHDATAARGAVRVRVHGGGGGAQHVLRRRPATPAVPHAERRRGRRRPHGRHLRRLPRPRPRRPRRRRRQLPHPPVLRPRRLRLRRGRARRGLYRPARDEEGRGRGR